MKYLLEISNIVTKKKVKKIEMFDDSSLKQKNSKFNEFYDLLMKGDLKNDRDAAVKLYGEISPTDDKYRQLKSRFKKRFLNTLFFLDVNQAANTNYNRAYFSCNKDWTLVRILISNNAHKTAAQLARSILLLALKYDFADIIVNSARILRDYAAKEINEKAFEEYNNYSKKYQAILVAETKAEELYQKLVFKKNKSSFPEEVKDTIVQIEKLYSLHPSPIIFFTLFVSKTLQAEHFCDYQHLLQLCNEAEAYIQTNPKFYREDKVLEIARKKLIARVHLFDYNEGQITCEKYLHSFGKTDIWVDIIEAYLLIAIYNKEYKEAHRIFNLAYTDKRFKKLTGVHKEKWSLFEVYLCFLQWNQSLDTESKPQKYKQFRVKRFLEEPILFPKRERVLSVISVIGQLLFLLEDGQLSEAFERIERLKGYSNKLLKNSSHPRLILFIKLLQQLAKVSFDSNKIGASRKYLDKLNSHKIKYDRHPNNFEIIPYEQLWDIILEICQK